MTEWLAVIIKTLTIEKMQVIIRKKVSEENITCQHGGAASAPSTSSAFLYTPPHRQNNVIKDRAQPHFESLVSKLLHQFLQQMAHR